MKKRLHVLICFVITMLSLVNVGLAQSSNRTDDDIHQMLVFLEKNQSNGKDDFPKGIFPSYRQYVFRPNVLKNDDNLFFTALVVFTLNEIYPKLSAADKKIVDNIRSKAISAFALYQNQKGRQTYNFWQTNPPKIFPHSGWMNWFDRQQALPDDFDDTAMGLLARQADTETVREVHQLMQGFINHPGKQVRNTFKAYRKIQAYSVWFGEKFPVDFDVCVLANTLYLVSAYQLPWTAADSASLVLIHLAIRNDDIIHHPDYIAPHYHTTAIILYHIARLYAIRPELFANDKAQLVATTKRLWAVAVNPVEKALLGSSLKKFGYRVAPENLGTSDISEYANSNFVFFIANMASMLPNPLKNPISKWGIGQFNYYCPAYNIALLLEYQMLSAENN